jgi:glycosyltransferase involved in cell wall biosynthesis
MSYEAFERIVWSLKYTTAKVIVHSHNAGFGSNAKTHTRLLHQIGKNLLKNKDFLRVACGDYAGKWIFEDKPFTILNNGVNAQKFEFNKAKRQEFREKYNISEDTIVLGHTGRIEIQKNHDFLIDIFNSYHTKNPNSKLMLVGDGSLKQSLENKVAMLNLSNDVIFTGFTKNVNEYYSAFDYFVMPSLFEGLSISLVEAQFNGLKCISSDSVDPTSDISKNVVFLSLKKSANDWAQEIINIESMRDINILKNINQDFLIENSVKKLEKFYEDNLD